MPVHKATLQNGLEHTLFLELCLMYELTTLNRH